MAARNHTDAWFFFGDSVTLGVNDDEALGGWVSRLALKGAGTGLYDLPPATFYNLGARRQAIAAIAARLKNEVAARDMPGLRRRIVLCAGTVDMLSGSSPEKAVEALERLLGQSMAIAPTLFVCPPPLANADANARLLVFADKAGEVCGKLGIPCINLTRTLDAEGFVQELSDGIHPGPKGNDHFADLLMQKEPMRRFLDPEAAL